MTCFFSFLSMDLMKQLAVLGSYSGSQRALLVGVNVNRYVYYMIALLLLDCNVR